MRWSLAGILAAGSLVLASPMPLRAAEPRAPTAQKKAGAAPKKGGTSQTKGGAAPAPGAAAPGGSDAEGLRLARLAGELEEQKKYDEAIQVAHQSLAAREKELGPNHTMVGATLGMIADLFIAKKEYASAIPFHERAAAITEKNKGPDSFELAWALERLGTTSLKAKDLGRAQGAFERSMRIHEKRRGVDSSDVARGVLWLGQVFAARDDFEKAEAAYQKAAALFEQNESGGKRPMVARTLTHLGRLYRDKGKYAKAVEVFEKALEIQVKDWREANDFVLNAMMELGLTHISLGNLHIAERLFEKVVEAEKQQVTGTPRQAASLQALAMIADEKGDFARAEPLYLEAIDLFEKTLPPGDIDIARAKLSLGSHYLTKGSLAEAEPLLTRAYEAWEREYGPESNEMATPLGILAELHRRRGDYARAEAWLTRVVAIDEKKRGPDHPRTSSDRVNLGRIVEARGDAARAEKLYERALAAHEKTLGKDHPAVAGSLFGLAELRRRKGDHASALQTYERARDIYKASLGADHLNIAKALEGIAALYVATKKVDVAVATQTRASDVYEHNVWLVLASGSESQKRDFLSTLLNSTDFTVNLHLGAAPKSKAAERLALTTILQRKGRVLDVMADTLASLRKRMSDQDRAVLDDLAAARGRLALATLRGPVQQSSEAHRSELAKMAEEVRRIEMRLGAHSQALTGKEAPVTIERVQAAIPDDARLIEYFVFRPRLSADEASDAKWGPPRYAAYTLDAAGNTRSIDLGPTTDIDPVVQRLRRSLASPVSADFKRIGRELDEKVMRPARALLGNTKKVLLSPDGLLNVVPFAALVDERGKFLVDSVELTYLTSGRDLLRLQQAPARAKSMTLIVANPAFGRPIDAQSPGEASRGALGGAVFQPLPGTAKEGKALRAIFGDGRAQLIVDSEATEDLLKRVEAPKILHIATHGFFLGDRTRAADGARALVLDAASPPEGTQAPPPEPRVSVENPLLRSGLALAGANGRKSGNDDGILTALEAASLDLRGTKLVVLSACETGLGDVQNGDGVYGMRRALVMAGAETQVASLWKVADEETRELMVSYYDKLNKGGGRSAALREVQLAMMARPATAHPYFWASFLVAGEAAPLPPEPDAGAQQKPAGAIPAGANGCACELAGRHKDGEGGPLSLAIGAAFAAIIAARRRSGHRSKGVH